MESLGRYALDLKLGLRMLRRFWGLTLVGGFAITVVVALATGSFSFLHTSLESPVPLDEGERLVGLAMWDAGIQRRVRPSRAQFERWREGLRSVEDLSAFTSVERRSASAPGDIEQPVYVAEMTASGFHAARVPPLLGRTLADADERAGAPAVVVIGFDVWASRYGSDPNVVGRSLRLSGTEHEIVGVMPEGYAFPVNHRYWTPLPPAMVDDRTQVFVFGRLANGYAIDNAQAEIEVIGTLPSPDDDPIETSPQVLPYTRALISSGEPLEEWLADFGGFLVSLLLLPPCLNIAILIYARTVTRQQELATRYALGASRSRIVTQLFLEVFLLAALSAALALLLVHAFFGLDLFRSERDPFWMDYSNVSVATVPFAAALAVLAALVAGTIPALQITGRMQQRGLGTPGSRATVRMGKTWTVLVVAQVALAVAALPAAIELGWGRLRPSLVGPGFAADRFLTFEYRVDAGASDGDAAGPGQAALREVHRRLVQRLDEEPGVAAATASAALPGSEPWSRVEIDSAGAAASPGFEFARLNRVDADFLGVFGIDVITGRDFEAGDVSLDNPPAVVNRTFAEGLGGNVLGRLIRIAAPGQEAGGWREIVGIVQDHPQNSDGPRIYSAEMGVPTPQLSLRLQPGASDLAVRLPEIVSGVDSRLYVTNVRSLADVYRQIEIGNNVQFIGLAAVMLSVVLLSISGVYALLSFTVNRRRHEIGIRSALGAQPGRIVFSVFRRALSQVAVGALLGLAAAALLDYFIPMEPVGGRSVAGVLPIVAVTMVLIGCLAALAPARRALKVTPTDALREVG